MKAPPPIVNVARGGLFYSVGFRSNGESREGIGWRVELLTKGQNLDPGTLCHDFDICIRCRESMEYGVESLEKLHACTP